MPDTAAEALWKQATEEISVADELSLPDWIGPPLWLVRGEPRMATKRHKPEEIVAKLQSDQGKARDERGARGI